MFTGMFPVFFSRQETYTPSEDACPGGPKTIKTKGVNITIVYLRVLIIQTGSTIILMVVEAQGMEMFLIFCSWQTYGGNFTFVGCVMMCACAGRKAK